MLLNRIYQWTRILFVLIIAFSCGTENEKPVNLDDPRVVKNIASDLIADKIKFTSSGYFSSDLKLSIVAGTESPENNQWGIKFKLIEKVNNKFQVVYSTDKLEGSFDKCIVDKMKLSTFKGELVYYNSQDYYMGTGGGDVFSYIINFVNSEVYYAHLIAEKSFGASLFLSENIQDPMLRKFFISYFKKDYPSLRIIKSDVL